MQSNRYDQIRPKCGLVSFVRIPTWVADDSSSEDLVVTGDVRMPMNPEIRFVLLDDALQATCKRGIERVALVEFPHR